MATKEDLFHDVDRAQGEIIALLQELVRADTTSTGVMPTGNERLAAEVLKSKLAADGIPSEILESASTRASIIARLPGSRGTPKLLYMSHLDVVPVDDPAQWQHPPFGGEIHEGRVWGRGASDCKSLVVAECMALILLKRANVRFQGDLIFCAGADEESGGEYGWAWLAQQHPDKIRADFAINEGGGTCMMTDKGPLYLFTVGEKGRLEVTVTVGGVSGHASVPWLSYSSLYWVAEAVKRIQNYQPELDTSTEVFRHLGQLGVEGDVIPQNVEAVVERVMAMNKRVGTALKAISRMTVVPTMVSGGVKSNVIPDKATFVCDVRTLPHQDEAYVRREFEKLLEGIPGVGISIKYTAVPSASPYETEFAEKVKRTTEEAVGMQAAGWAPVISNGFTDSRLVRPLGIVTYNFSAGDPNSDPEKMGAHNANESFDIASLIIKTKHLIALAFETLNGA